MSDLEPQQTFKTVSIMHDNMKTMRQLQSENERLRGQVAIGNYG